MCRRFVVKNTKWVAKDIEPAGGKVIVAVKYDDGNNQRWLYNVEVFGIPNFLVSADDIFDELIGDIDDNTKKLVDETSISEFEGIMLGEYSEIQEEIEQQKDNPASLLIKYIVEVTLADADTTNRLIENTIGKYLDEVNRMSS